MPTIRQLIQTSPAKANELFAKLAETSGNAVKTRERLFSELKEELELQMRLEEQHLFPVLRKRIRPALTRGNRHIPLQDRHRSWPARPDSAGSEN
jgi:Hemerythrin HHE cation binding domain